MKKVLLVVIVLAVGSLSFAGNPAAATVNDPQETAAALEQKDVAQTMPHSVFSSANCAFTFTSGAGDSFLKYCVTANGNITVFQTPVGHEHIAIGQDGEGYGFCDLASGAAYFDYAESGDSGNWGPATVTKQTAKLVKIARTTSDGIWTLTQTFTQITGTFPSVKIDMTVRNNTATNRTLDIMRYVDVDADGRVQNDLAATSNSAFGWIQTPHGAPGIGRDAFGLVLQGTPFPDSADGPEAYTQNVSVGPAPCAPFRNYVLPAQIATDGSLVALYEIDVPKNASKTVTVSYKGL